MFGRNIDGESLSVNTRVLTVFEVLANSPEDESGASLEHAENGGIMSIAASRTIIKRENIRPASPFPSKFFLYITPTPFKINFCFVQMHTNYNIYIVKKR